MPRSPRLTPAVKEYIRTHLETESPRLIAAKTGAKVSTIYTMRSKKRKLKSNI